MDLERLANELLLNIFEYFSATQLVRAFHGLNKRFDGLVFIHFQSYRFDFRATSKQDFSTVCDVNLPLIKDCIVSFGLSDDDDTPQQIYLFRSYGWSFNQFPNLRSLSFDRVRSSEIISDILLECPNLTHLTLIGCYFGCKQVEVLHFINSIWSLSKLFYCYLDIDLKTGLNISTPTVFSLSMEHLSIVGVPYRIVQLINVCEHTPHLRYLALDLYRIGDDEALNAPILSITELNLVFVVPQHGTIENLLQYVPNLRRLKLETCYVEINGYEWEQIIRSYLPKLEQFQLKMRFQIVKEKYKNELLKSFQTRFWLQEHRWFIRFHYNIDDPSNMICLYTLPYSFSYLDILFPVLFRSTCPNDNNYLLYTRVQHLLYRSSSIKGLIASELYFSNINHLSIKLPVNDHLLSIIQKIERLNFLEVSRSNNISDENAQSQLQALLDYSSHVHSLKFKSWSETQLRNRQSSIREKLTPIVIKTRSIRQLNLLGYDRWFSEEECIELSRSFLGMNCEVLFIKVKSRISILNLIKAMSHLRALIVRSKDDNWKNYSLSVEDELVHWLQQNLSSMCSVKRDFRFAHHLRIWIHL